MKNAPVPRGFCCRWKGVSLAERFPRVKELAAYLRLWRKGLILLWQRLQRPAEVKGEFEELLGNKGGVGTVV